MTLETVLHLGCSAVITLLYPYLDRELNEAEQAQVRAHLDGCGNCARVFRFEDAVLSLVGVRLSHVRAPADLRARIVSLTHQAN